MGRTPPKKRDSGIEWIGEIPTHWDVAKTRYVAKLESGHTPSRQVPEYWDNCTIPWFTLNDVWQLRAGRRHVSETSELISELGLANSSARLLPKGTVILSRTASVGFAGILERSMATTQDFVNWICGPRLLPEYLYYVFLGMQNELKRVMRGSTHQTIYMPVVQQFSTPIPPLAEQQFIAALLDRETTRIDALIDKKRRLLELLEEKRLAVITHAVTKGLDPTAPMKDSGIDWLGEIPAHWSVSRAKFVTSSITSGSRGWAEFYSDEGPIFLQSGNIGSNMELNLAVLQRVSPPAGAEGRRTIVAVGDVLVCITGARTGAVAHVSEDFGESYINQHVALLRPVPSRVFPRFLSYSLWSNFGREQLWLSSYGMKEGLGLEHVLDVQIAKPPTGEQELIAEHIDGSCAKIDVLAGKVNVAIERLQEYRSALITAAVTGKIDVRGRAEQKEAAE